MFEGSHTETGFDTAAKPGGLQPLEWAALSAQLAAARDLQHALRSQRTNCEGNFARFSATRDEVVNENEAHVNREALADRKCSGVIVPDTANEANSGDREL